LYTFGFKKIKEKEKGEVWRKEKRKEKKDKWKILTEKDMKTLHPYMPHLNLSHIDFSSPSPSGVRAQALNPDGKLVEDFVYGILSFPPPLLSASLFSFFTNQHLALIHKPQLPR
jgi:hypothetical protein